MKKNIKIAQPVRKRIVKWVLGFLAVFTILLITTYFVVRANIGRLETTINAALKEQLNGKVSIGEIDITVLNHFPHFSLSLKDIVVEDARFDEHGQKILVAKRAYLQIRVFELLKGNIELRAITLKDAEINLLRLKDGALNSKGFAKAKVETVPPEEKSIDAILISRVYLENVRINYVDEVWGKKFDLTFKDSFTKLEHGSEISTIDSKDKVYVAGLTFKPEKGSCLTDKTLNLRLNLQWNRTAHSIIIEPSTAEVDRNKFSLEGSVEPGITPYLKLAIKSTGIKMDYATTLVSNYTREKLAGYNFDKKIPMEIMVEGAFNPGLPMKMDLYFNIEDNTFTTPTKMFEDVSLVGHYFNHLNDTLINDERNSGVTFTDFKGKFENIPFVMDMRVTDLTDPYMAVIVKSDIDLKSVNNAVDTSIINFSTGTLKLDIDFKGKVKGYLENEKDSINAFINGSALITNASCKLPGKKYDLQNINADIGFEDKAMLIKNLGFNINKNPVQVTATISEFINVFFFDNTKLQANATVTTNSFNLDNFKKPTSSKKAGKQSKKIASIITSTLENLEGNLILDGKKVTYHKLVAENVKGNITLGNGYITCKGVSLNAADGNFNLDGKITGIGSNAPFVSIYTTISGADISKLFYQLDNFNQTTVTSSNLKGKLDAQVTYSSSLNKSFLVDPLTMAGKLNLVVRQGELVNMSSLNEISKNVFKNKDFSDIQFAELKTTATIAGQEFYIDEMEIQSNLLALYIQGVYSFGNKTELFIKVPIKSLKNQDEDYIAENKAADEKIGMSINLKATKPDGKLKIAPLLFRKKDKE